MITRTIYINNSAFLLRTPENRPPSNRAIVMSHGRFQLTNYITGKANVRIPEGVETYCYIRHGELMRFNSHEHKSAMPIYNALQRNTVYAGDIQYAKKYTETMKNYTLYPMYSGKWDVFDQETQGILPHSPFDVIIPQTYMHVSDIFLAITNGRIHHKELHFLTCRGVRLTRSSI